MRAWSGMGVVLSAAAAMSCGGAVAYVDASATGDVGADAAVEVDRPAAGCVAGRTKACPCADGRSGAQTCGADGTYGACMCFPLDAGVVMDVPPVVDVAVAMDVPVAMDVATVVDVAPAMDVASAPDAAPAEDLPPASAPDAAAQTYDYVINRMVLDEGALPGTTTRAFYGFNLDGRFSPSRTALQQPADCDHGDYFSAVDPTENAGTCVVGMAAGGPDCRGGVDNQYPSMVQSLRAIDASFDVQAALDAGFAAGRGLILVRVSGVNGAPGPTLNDPAVTVMVYPYVWPAFTDCARVTRRDQIYAVDDRSLLVPNDLSTARVQFEGRIVNGRVRVTPRAGDAGAVAINLGLALNGVPIRVPLRQSRYQFALGETDLTGGNLGGYLRAQDLVDVVTSDPALRVFRDAAAPLLQGFVDVATGSAPSCLLPQGGIGVGLGFSAVRAVILSTTVTSAPVGVCGAPR